MKNTPGTPPAPVPTRLIKPITQKGYLNCLEAMRAWSIRARTEITDEPPLVNMLDLAQDIMAREDLATRSKNNYRAALLWHLRQQTRLDAADQDALALLAYEIRPPFVGKCPKSAPLGQMKIGTQRTRLHAFFRAFFGIFQSQFMSKVGITATDRGSLISDTGCAL